MRFSFAIPAVVLLWPALAAAQPPATQEPAPFFPVMAWDGPPNDPAVLKEMRECGINVAGFVPVAALDNCHAAGLKAIVTDSRVTGYDWAAVDAAKARENVKSLVAECRNHPAVYGYHLRDEPVASWFPGLKVVSDAVKEFHPGVWPYINLFPNYADLGQLGAASYDEYVDKYVETCQPPILSYDHYAILEGGGFRPKYWGNLKSMRRASLQHNLPFWQIVLANACIVYREPTNVDYRFQVYTSLAYGAKGLAWFKYFSAPVGNFRDGPIDQFGHKTPAWDMMRFVNLQIEKLAPTLLKLTSNEVYHFGDVPPGADGPPAASLVANIPGQMLVGDFTHQDGTRYVMVVNKDFEKSTICAPQFRTPTKALEMVSPYTGALIPYEGEQVWLAPGQGVLLKLIP
jgi:hypothetical protein